MSSPGQAANPATANLDASKVNEASLAEAAFPGQFQRDFRIHWEEKVHDEVIKHAAETTDVELCGVLVGKVVKDRDGPYLTISGSIRGEQAKHDGAQVTFTHDTWDHIHKVKDEKFPKEQIVGWYHTHPGFGIFLSGMDVFIHEFFFNGATQVAHVIDPRTGEEGAFQWKAGKVERVPRFWIGSREKACATGPTGQRPMAAVATVAATAAAAAVTRRDEDEFDILKVLWDWLNWFAPYGLACMFGFLLHFFYWGFEVKNARDELLRAEVRSLVGSAASAFASSEELRGLQQKLEALATSSATPAEQKGLKDLSADVAALRSTTVVREEVILRALNDRQVAGQSIEDDIRSFRAETRNARLLAFEAYLQSFRTRIDLEIAVTKELPPARRRVLQQELESQLGLEMNELQRELLRSKFPELYVPAPEAPKSPEPPKKEK
jgi:proteasome lid subunit RPN8/RPN11